MRIEDLDFACVQAYGKPKGPVCHIDVSEASSIIL